MRQGYLNNAIRILLGGSINAFRPVRFCPGNAESIGGEERSELVDEGEYLAIGRLGGELVIVNRGKERGGLDLPELRVKRDTVRSLRAGKSAGFVCWLLRELIGVNTTGRESGE